tara:strand:+ start:852 stop:2114 length:1263 start_codon:yes stop_codon:yes gene_type:complete
MEDVINPDNTFNFSRIRISTPRPLQGGTYVAKLHNIEAPIIIQAPKCFSKKGIKETGTKVYCDLLFTEEDREFIDWVRNLEERVREIIVENRELWFASEVTMDDIEYAWNDCIKEKGKGYLLKTFIERKKKNLVLQVFNDYEEEVDYKKIDSKNELINILEISQLKFSSDNFQITVHLRQMMVFKKKEYFKKCLIKIGNNVAIKEKEVTEDFKEVTEDVKEVAEDVKEVTEDVKEVTEDVKEMTEDVKEMTEDVKELDDYNNDVDIDNISCDFNGEEETLVNSKQETSKQEMTENTEIKNKENSADNDVENKDLDNLKLLDITDSFDIMNGSEKLIIKKPNEVYKELYMKAKAKAKKARNEALRAHLEAKNIKQRYLLDELIDSDTETETETETESDYESEKDNEIKSRMNDERLNNYDE